MAIKSLRFLLRPARSIQFGSYRLCSVSSPSHLPAQPTLSQFWIPPNDRASRRKSVPKKERSYEPARCSILLTRWPLKAFSQNRDPTSPSRTLARQVEDSLECCVRTAASSSFSLTLRSPLCSRPDRFRRESFGALRMVRACARWDERKKIRPRRAFFPIPSWIKS